MRGKGGMIKSKGKTRQTGKVERVKDVEKEPGRGEARSPLWKCSEQKELEMVTVSHAGVACAPTSCPCAGADPSCSSAWDFFLQENTGPVQGGPERQGNPK